jgi:Eukaryotic rRNA processing protein EBP2
LLDETAGVQASEDAKRQRDLKKFGKKVQIEKLQERQKKKTEDMEKIKMLKRSK